MSKPTTRGCHHCTDGHLQNNIAQSDLDLAPFYQAKRENYEPYIPDLDGLAITIRILACRSLEIRPKGFDRNIQRLASLQCEDGGWPACMAVSLWTQ